jgi:hypothetical protein
MPERRRQHGRPRHRLDYNIKIASKQVGCENVDWIHLKVTTERSSVLGFALDSTGSG